MTASQASRTALARHVYSYPSTRVRWRRLSRVEPRSSGWLVVQRFFALSGLVAWALIGVALVRAVLGWPQ